VVLRSKTRRQTAGDPYRLSINQGWIRIGHQVDAWSRIDRYSPPTDDVNQDAHEGDGEVQLSTCSSNQWKDATMESFTTNDGVSLAFQDTGQTGSDAPPLVIVHSWIQTQATFHHQVDGLAPRRRVVTLDLRGHGLSDKPDHGYRLARLARDVYQLLDHLQIDLADFLATSMGVSVCWSLIDQYGTDRIRRLVFVDQPAVVGARPWMTEQDAIDGGVVFDHETLSGVCLGLLGPHRDAVVSGAVRGAFSGDPDPAVMAFIEREAMSTPGFVAAYLLWDHAAQDWRDLLPRIDVPTLVIGCEGSHISPASQRFVAAQIPDARVQILTSAVANSHFPYLENPSAFNSIVESFLDETL
jgi:pimeloyl-ACP methyl ester carboxylesterase